MNQKKYLTLSVDSHVSRQCGMVNLNEAMLSSPDVTLSVLLVPHTKSQNICLSNMPVHRVFALSVCVSIEGAGRSRKSDLQYALQWVSTVRKSESDFSHCTHLSHASGDLRYQYMPFQKQIAAEPERFYLFQYSDLCERYCQLRSLIPVQCSSAGVTRTQIETIRRH